MLVTLCVSVSKADPGAKGAFRSHGCSCGAQGGLGGQGYPYVSVPLRIMALECGKKERDGRYSCPPVPST
eukprot:1585825-Amphidinium_carterae.1